MLRLLLIYLGGACGLYSDITTDCYKSFELYGCMLHISRCRICRQLYTLCYTCVCARVCVVGVIGDSGLITTLMLFSQRPLKLPSTPSSQCVVARQPRVRCSRAALFVPYEWFARERKDGRRWGREKEIHKLVNGRPSLEGPWINAWANNLCLSLSAAISLSLAPLLLHCLVSLILTFIL